MTHGVLYKINAGVLANGVWGPHRLPGLTSPAAEPDVTHVQVRHRQPENGVLYSPQGGIRRTPLEGNGYGRWLDVYA